LESQINKSKIVSIKVKGQGEIANYLDSLATFVTVGAMSHSNESINYVNADFIAKEQGIKTETINLGDSEVYKNLITVKLTTNEGTTSVSATIFEDGLQRVVTIDGFENEVALKGDMVLFKNNDVPGVIGSVGSILANNNVNIADFSLARNSKSEALAVILVDNAVNDATIAELASLEASISVKYARL